MTAEVVVVGSINVDTRVGVAVLPRPGETVAATRHAPALGGKGANQSIAAARTGADTTLIACIGSDGSGRDMKDRLLAAKVHVDTVFSTSGPTGGATVVVDDNGENIILVEAGANAQLSPRLIDSAADRITSAGVIVAQGEANLEGTRKAIELARGARVPVLLNLAPYRAELREPGLADVLILNETEAEALLGTALPVDGIDLDLLQWSPTVIVTLGARGAVIINRTGTTQIRAPKPASIVDTTGAGDAFVGVLAAGIAAGVDLHIAATAAVTAATAAVSVPGAGENYPDFTHLLPSTSTQPRTIHAR